MEWVDGVGRRRVELMVGFTSGHEVPLGGTLLKKLSWHQHFRKVNSEANVIVPPSGKTSENLHVFSRPEKFHWGLSLFILKSSLWKHGSGSFTSASPSPHLALFWHPLPLSRSSSANLIEHTGRLSLRLVCPSVTSRVFQGTFGLLCLRLKVNQVVMNLLLGSRCN